MKHIKSYEQFLNEAEDKAKEIEKTINKISEPKDDEKELEKDMDASKEKNAKPKAGTKSEKDNDAKEEEELKDKAPKDEIKEAKKVAEDHEEMDDKVMAMGLGDVLSIMKEKDPKGYEDMEAYIKKNFSKAADESWFTTMTA